MEEKIYWLGWQMLLPGCAARVWLLANYFGSLKYAWRAPDKELVAALGIEEGPTRQHILHYKRRLNPEQVMHKLQEKNIDYVWYYDTNYPPQLKDIYDPPPGLFVRGRLKVADPAVAIVGSRQATVYGLKIAENLGRQLAQSGVAVISGMARGIDTAAHKGALAENGFTAAVLGCGVDVVYPPENERIMESIALHGAVVSEFPPGTEPKAWHFPVRNRMISGLSRCVVVVEAAEKSGALITADLALEQGREVAAVPGNVTSRLSKGPNNLIKQGAKLVESASDVLEELGFGKLFREETTSNGVGIELSKAESKIFALLCSEPLSLDEIMQRFEGTPGEALSLLMYLELKGIVKQLPGKRFVKL